MKPPRFAYARPESIEEALALLAEADASVLAGGMSLAAMLNMRLAGPELVIDINRLPGCDTITTDGDTVHTPCLVRQADALLDGSVPLLTLALPHVGHMQTRNRGTLCGSVAHADPSAEVPLCLTALGGQVELGSQRGTRRMPAEEFFEGLLTTLREPDEMITGLIWPRAAPGTGYGFAEIAQRRGDFALAAAAAWARLDGDIAELGFALGGIEDRPRLFRPDASGMPATQATARELAAAAIRELDTMSDHQADAGFRRQLGVEMATHALCDAFAGATG
ncbi:MAG: FAD binding domain-containing protein [Alphaproteobacteria bacterium]|jgi:2-furoyl-CoA dehydrogenase FAD binding subunit|nr:FAD binding domain-containing protein [Alphaproteobacteria bacterium]